MSRPVVSVKRVAAELEPSFTELWVASRVEAGVSPEVAARAASEGRLRAALDREDVRAFLALGDGGEPVGFAVAAHEPVLRRSPRHPSVAIDQLYVVPRARKHGVARHLMAAVTAVCRRRSAASRSAATCPAQHREANRFFARLGFSSQIVRRVTSAAPCAAGSARTSPGTTGAAAAPPPLAAGARRRAGRLAG